MTFQTGSNATDIPDADITKKPVSKWSLDAISADLRELLPKESYALQAPEPEPERDTDGQSLHPCVPKSVSHSGAACEAVLK